MPRGALAPQPCSSGLRGIPACVGPWRWHPPAPQAWLWCFLSGGSCLLGCGPWSQAGAAWAGRGSEVWCQPCASPWSGPGYCPAAWTFPELSAGLQGGQTAGGFPRTPFDFLQRPGALEGECACFLEAVPAGVYGRWGFRRMGRVWGGGVPVLPQRCPPQLRGGREAVLGMGAGIRRLTAAVRAHGSSCSTRLGGLGEGPRPWVVTSWGCGWGLAPRGPGGHTLGTWRVNVTFSKFSKEGF